MISETVQIALVTFASGAVGAFFGYLGARYSANAQIRKSAMNAYFSARLDAYTLYYNKYAAYIQDANNPECLADLLNSISRVRLVSSDKTSALLEELSQTLSQITPLSTPPEDFNWLRGQILVSMQEDLRCFQRRRFS